MGSHAFRNIMLLGVAGAFISKQQYKVVDVAGYPARMGKNITEMTCRRFRVTEQRWCCWISTIPKTTFARLAQQRSRGCPARVWCVPRL